jgi:hypothetical protein
MKSLIASVAIFIVVVLGAGALWLRAASAPPPVVGTPNALPTVITVNKNSVVTVAISIPGSLVIRNGVNLLRLGATGTQPVTLGVMHDDGQSGDAVAGDGIYTLQVTFTEPATRQIQLEVSAAFQGLLKRVVSSPIDIAVTAGGTRPLPPDPGPAGMTTLAGVDSDGDGVRDEVERYIALSYATSAKMQAALTQVAKGYLAEILDSTQPPTFSV